VPKLPFVDPYLIAHLRGGADEAIRVSTLALIDRGLIEATGESLHAKPSASEQVRRPLERGILTALRQPQASYGLVKDPAALTGAESLRTELTELGLVPSAIDMHRRAMIGMSVLLGLWIVAGLKISVALARGRHNVGFLIFFALLAALLLWSVLQHARTDRGDRLLSDLRTLFSGLRDRASTLRGGGASQELALLVSVFGIAALEGKKLTLAKKLFPRAMTGTSSSTSCGSSCSSLSSASCGGGGGCGGGCGGGGCGGCGG
jgi:uncharacterized protein (TIGR04222 family)